MKRKPGNQDRKSQFKKNVKTKTKKNQTKKQLKKKRGKSLPLFRHGYENLKIQIV